LRPFRIRSCLGIEALIRRAYPSGGNETRTPDDLKQAGSLLGVGETLRFAVDSGVVSFPVAVSSPDQPGAPPAQPDGLMRWPQGEIAVEVTQVTWDKLRQVLEAAREDRSGAAVEMATELCGSGKADGRRAKRTGDYRHIGRSGERFDARGFGSDEAERLTVEAIRNRVSSKTWHLPLYRRSAE
jgi:hypothetical protein